VTERFRIRTIPRRTSLDVARERGSVRISGLSAGRYWQDRPEQNSGGFNIEDHVFRKSTKSTKEKQNKPLIIPENERIAWEVEVHEDYDTQGRLGVILQFSEIEFTDTPVFERSRHDYGPDSRVFYSPVGYKNGRAFLILATYGDILESQVVAAKIDVGPFFKEETLLSPLTVTHDPTSMTVYGKNHLVVVGYNRLKLSGPV